ncbi:MAG: hypothetical protein HYW25_00565 [Candidatus Aenigmarchaeota archaeon]|nr:hypothetical protein [Candidatus Aenigmarchaeota archaeon]
MTMEDCYSVRERKFFTPVEAHNFLVELAARMRQREGRKEAYDSGQNPLSAYRQQSLFEKRDT